MERNKKKAKKQAEKKRQKWYNARVNAHLYVKGKYRRDSSLKYSKVYPKMLPMKN